MSADRRMLTDEEILAALGIPYEPITQYERGQLSIEVADARRIEALVLERVAADEKARGGMGGGGPCLVTVAGLQQWLVATDPARHPSDPAQTERCNHLSYYDNDGPCGICDGRASADPAQDLPPRVHTHNGNACYLPCVEQPTAPQDVERLRERAIELTGNLAVHECRIWRCDEDYKPLVAAIDALADAAGRKER